MDFRLNGKIYCKLDARGENNSFDLSWDDGVQGQIKQIYLWHDDDSIFGLQTIYESRGARLISRKHGGTQGNFEMINPKKPLTWLSGHYGSYGYLDFNYKVITSLKFGNERETYGPFGCAEGTPFFFRTNSQIVGFHGSGCSSVDGKFGSISTIGLYIKPKAFGVIGEPFNQNQSLRMIKDENKLNSGK